MSTWIEMEENNKRKKEKVKEGPLEGWTVEQISDENDDTPVRAYKRYSHRIDDSEDPGYVNKVLVATPTTGLVRMEWCQARHGQIIPVNWSQVQMVQYMNTYVPLHYTVADAQNLIVKEVVEKDFEWLLMIEHDNLIPPDCFIRMNQYMRGEKHPVVSGLYYTKNNPTEPLVFRGRGTSVYTDWERGDKVWVDAVPMGCVLIHGGILREMWKDSKEYMAGKTKTRAVFHSPRSLYWDEDNDQFNTKIGTSDLEWSSRVIEEGYLKKAGWDEFAKKKYPFLIDTNIFVKHIDQNGNVFPDCVWRAAARDGKINLTEEKPKFKKEVK